MIDAIVAFVDLIMQAGRIFFGLVTVLGLIGLVGILGFFIDVGE